MSNLHWQPARFGARSYLTVTWWLVAVKGTEQYRKHKQTENKDILADSREKRHLDPISTERTTQRPLWADAVLDQTVPCTLSPLGAETETKAKT